MLRYHGRELVGVLRDDRVYGNQGGTAESCVFVPEVKRPQGFFNVKSHMVRKKESIL